MKTRTKLIGAGATVAVLSAVGLGVAVADPTTPSSTPTSTASPSANAKPGAPGKHAEGKHKKELFRRALHGEATVGGAKKTHVIDFQRGTVTKVEGSVITVKSTDGFSASYTAGDKTKVRKDKSQSTIGEVKVNDRVRVVATKDGSTTTLTHVADAGPKK